MIRLAPRTDVDTLAGQYLDSGLVQIPDLLHDEDARRLHACLCDHVPWGLAYFDQGARYLRAGDLARLSGVERAALQEKILDTATHAYQYAYDAYPVLDAYLQKWGEVPLLERYLEFLNSEPMLDLVRMVTDEPAIIKADAQATAYGPGQFLRQHVDESREGETWLVAFVLNLTHEWDPDWGGYLQLYDEHGDVRRALKPRFNVMNLLKVPQPHSVTMVAPFAAARRYAVTGWFRSQ